MKLTDTTWSTLPHEQLTPDVRLGWEAQSDLGHELAERSNLTIEQARLLVSAVGYALPVVLTWTNTVYEYYTSDRRGTETHTTAVIVTRIHPGQGDPGYPGIIRVNYWGFSHDIYLNKIVDVVTPERGYTLTHD